MHVLGRHPGLGIFFDHVQGHQPARLGQAILKKLLSLIRTLSLTVFSEVRDDFINILDLCFPENMLYLL